MTRNMPTVIKNKEHEFSVQIWLVKKHLTQLTI